MKHLTLFFVLIVLLISSPRAHAHAFLDAAEPKVGSTINTSPHCVKIWFTERLNQTVSTIAVFDAGGKEVDKADSAVDPGNRFLMAVSLPTLPDGTYRVAWSAVAVDTHPTQGIFTLTIKTSR